jgi:hypothetical protein
MPKITNPTNYGGSRAMNQQDVVYAKCWKCNQVRPHRIFKSNNYSRIDIKFKKQCIVCGRVHNRFSTFQELQRREIEPGSPSPPIQKIKHNHGKNPDDLKKFKKLFGDESFKVLVQSNERRSKK